MIRARGGASYLSVSLAAAAAAAAATLTLSGCTSQSGSIATGRGGGAGTAGTGGTGVTGDAGGKGMTAGPTGTAVTGGAGGIGGIGVTGTRAGMPTDTPAASSSSKRPAGWNAPVPVPDGIEDDTTGHKCSEITGHDGSRMHANTLETVAGRPGCSEADTVLSWYYEARPHWQEGTTKPVSFDAAAYRRAGLWWCNRVSVHESLIDVVCVSRDPGSRRVATIYSSWA